MMAMAEKMEKQNRLHALLYTVGLHTIILLLMFFVAAWHLPNPPIPDSGMLINLGFDEQGGGDIQPEEPVGSPQKSEDKPEETRPQEQVAEEVKESSKPVAEEKAQQEELLTSKDAESPVVVPEKKEEKKVVEKPKEEPKKEEPKKEDIKKENAIAVYKPSNKSESKTSEGDNREGKPGSQGDDKDKIGDKGNPNGTPDANALYGKPGGGGKGVSMTGFKGFDWPEVQTPSLPEDANGVYEFIVKVDADGTVTKVEPVQRGLSLEAERKLRAIIQQLEFTPKGLNLPPESEGRITFRVVSR